VPAFRDERFVCLALLDETPEQRPADTGSPARSVHEHPYLENSARPCNVEQRDDVRAGAGDEAALRTRSEPVDEPSGNRFVLRAEPVVAIVPAPSADEALHARQVFFSRLDLMRDGERTRQARDRRRPGGHLPLPHAAAGNGAERKRIGMFSNAAA
jgi:hypothetical protein